jgi:hypothetical protein
MIKQLPIDQVKRFLKKLPEVRLANRVTDFHVERIQKLNLFVEAFINK